MGEEKKETAKNENLGSAVILIVFIFIGVVLIFGIFFSGPRADTLSCKDSKRSIAINRDLYSLCFNRETRQPYWVLQILDQRSFKSSQSGSPKDYLQDPEIPKSEQASEMEYKHSHWVMGNFLFPFSKQDEELSGESSQDQYLFSVTSPQDPNFHKGYWEKLRDRVKTLSMKDRMLFNNHVAVLSGPLFLSKDGRTNKGILGENQIPIPTYFFQVIAPTTNANDIEAYIVPNEEISEAVSLDDFKVSIKEFEKKTKIKGVESIANDLQVIVPVPM